MQDEAQSLLFTADRVGAVETLTGLLEKRRWDDPRKRERIWGQHTQFQTEISMVSPDSGSQISPDFQIPAYAPELNPDEQVWTRTKYMDLANFCPDNLPELARAVRHSLVHTKTHQSLLRSCFAHAKLKL